LHFKGIAMNYLILFLTWLAISIALIVGIERDVDGTHSDGMGYFIVGMYSIPFWFIVFIVWAKRHWRRRDD
jgi:hypothetical protein